MNLFIRKKEKITGKKIPLWTLDALELLQMDLTSLLEADTGNPAFQYEL